MYDQLRKFADAPARKNVAIAAGFLVLAMVGAAGFSVDQFLVAWKGA